MQGSQLSEAITQLDCIKRKFTKLRLIMKISKQREIVSIPSRIPQYISKSDSHHASNTYSIIKNKDTILEELILWDFEDDYSDEQLFRNLFSLVTDLLEEKYPNRVRKLTASETQKIIEDCLSQIKQAIEHHKQFKHISDILAFESYIDKNDSMINLQISTSKVAETIQWDLDNAFQYIDEFAYTYCYENKLGQENIVQIGNQIREQIQKAFEKGITQYRNQFWRKDKTLSRNCFLSQITLL